MGGLPSLVPLIVLAVVFCLAYERTGTIGTTIVAHALFNLNTFVLDLGGHRLVSATAPVLKDRCAGSVASLGEDGADPSDPALAGPGVAAVHPPESATTAPSIRPPAGASSSPSIPSSTGSISTGGCRPRPSGAKLLKRNLSDLAAMGGRPRAAVVALALDRRCRLAGSRSSTGASPAASRRYGVSDRRRRRGQAAGSLVATLTLTGEAAGPRCSPARARGPATGSTSRAPSGGAWRPATTTASSPGSPRARGSPAGARCAR